MFDIGFCSLIAFLVIAILVGLMDNSRVSKEIVYATMGIGYGGVAIGFIIASLKWLFLAI